MPLAIDLFCGLGGWTDGLLAEGWSVVGFDIERHDYGTGGYPAQLVLQDVLTIHGRQFKDAVLIVASPPCQEFSYMAMPWSLAKKKRERILADAAEQKRLTALFDACFRIQREASEAASRHIPLIVENVRGAIPWVGRSRWNYGSYHLWGDVPALMPMTKKVLKGGWLSQADGAPMRRDDGVKVPGFRFDGNGGSFQTAAVEGRKNTGGSWFGIQDCKAQIPRNDPRVNNNPVSGVKVPSDEGRRTDIGKGARFMSRDCGDEGTKLGGTWFHDYRKGQGPRNHGSKSKARKAASAAIAKIPFHLAQYIAAHFKD